MRPLEGPGRSGGAVSAAHTWTRACATGPWELVRASRGRGGPAGLLGGAYMDYGSAGCALGGAGEVRRAVPAAHTWTRACATGPRELEVRRSGAGALRRGRSGGAYLDYGTRDGPRGARSVPLPGAGGGPRRRFGGACLDYGMCDGRGARSVPLPGAGGAPEERSGGAYRTRACDGSSKCAASRAGGARRGRSRRILGLGHDRGLQASYGEEKGGVLRDWSFKTAP